MPDSDEDNYNNDEDSQPNSDDTPTTNSDDESGSGPSSRMRYELSSDLGQY